MQSWYTIRSHDEGAELLIYDEIGAYGVSAKSFLADLGALDSNAPLDLRLNSPGGSVFDAVAIYNALQRHEGTVTVTIDGIAASAASYIAMAGDTVVMPENTFLMIHEPSGMVMGNAGDMRSMAEALDKIAGSLVRGYAAKSGRPDEGIAALMAAETWLDAADALELGLADKVIEPVRIAASFDITRFRNAPVDLVEAVEKAGMPDNAGPESGDADAGTPAPVPEPTDVIEPEPAPLKPYETAADSEPNPSEPAPPDLVAIHNKVMTYAKAVVDLCRLAGQPQMTASFLTDETSLEDIRNVLIDARAAAEPEITSAHPQPGPAPQAKPWGDVIARTFKRKG
jgi:ATP-dependent Clp endopeptidase proteolytic subunit ClpP